MSGKRRNLYKKMNAQRETESQPRIWSRSDNQPLIARQMNAPIEELGEIVIPDIEEIVENPTDDLVILPDIPTHEGRGP